MNEWGEAAVVSKKKQQQAEQERNLINGRCPHLPPTASLKSCDFDDSPPCRFSPLFTCHARSTLDLLGLNPFSLALSLSTVDDLASLVHALPTPPPHTTTHHTPPHTTMPLATFYTPVDESAELPTFANILHEHALASPHSNLFLVPNQQDRLDWSPVKYGPFDRYVTGLSLYYKSLFRQQIQASAGGKPPVVNLLVSRRWWSVLLALALRWVH